MSNRRKAKSRKGSVIRTILVVVAVVAAAWYLGGKPTVKITDGKPKVEQTEYPLVYKLQGTIREKTDNILDFVTPDLSASKEKTKTEKNEISSAPATAKAPVPVEAKTEKKSNTSSGTSGSNPKIDQGHAENSPLFFGNPSDALFNKSNDKNYLLEKPQFTISYNTETLCPNWVAWHLDSKDIGTADRSNDFRADLELPQEWYGVTKADYQYNSYGFDRGHVCPSADRTATQEDNSMTFLMTNMVPQTPDNNRVIWMHFENYERQLVSQGNEVYIIAGPYGTGGTSGKGTFDSIPITLKSGETVQMNVPASTWKVCLVLPDGEGDISRITKDTTVIAINVPNKMGMGKTGDWEQFLTSIDEIESLTGYDFFELLSDDIEDALESKVYEYSK